MGALNFYSDRPDAFGPELDRAGFDLRHPVALAWNMFRRSTQFRSALASRDFIGQVKGIIMERFKVDAVGAFELLTHLSQESNTKLVEIARQIIDDND